MDQILNQLGELVLGSVPTMILFILLVAAYGTLVRRPLDRVLAERRARTSGAVERARAAIAKAESDDTGTAVNGGTLPPFTRGQMVPEFEQAVLSQPLGKVSAPVKTKFGYHIILVEDRTSKTFEEAKPELEKQVKPGLVREAMDKLEKQTPVTLDDAYFGPVIGSGTLSPAHPPVPSPAK